MALAVEMLVDSTMSALTRPVPEPQADGLRNVTLRDLIEREWKGW
jgi:hypothetical protein